MFSEELVDDFAEKLVRYQGGVLVVGDDDTADTFGAAVGVEGVVCCMHMRVSIRAQYLTFQNASFSHPALQHPVAVPVEYARQRSLQIAS